MKSLKTRGPAAGRGSDPLNAPLTVQDTIDSHDRLAKLEFLVDELIKESPQEARIRAYMKSAGLRYSEDPIERMNSVLAALDGERKPVAKRGGEHGRDL